MYTNTRATSTIFVLLVVTATSLLLISSSTMAGLAAKSDLSDTSAKRHDQSRTHDSGRSGDNFHSAKSASPSTTAINENPNLDTLLACESSAANGSGHLTKSEVMNCYLQFSRGSASSISILGDDQNSDRSGGGSGPGLASHHHVGSTTKIHLNSHRHASADPSGLAADHTSTG